MKTLEAGATIGYRGCYACNTTETIATLGVGFADGFPTHSEGLFVKYENGEKANVVGNVFMDLTMVKVHKQVKTGDIIMLLNRDIAVEWAAKLHQSCMSLLCSITSRVQRIYIF